MTWDLLNQIRQRVREEEGVLYKPSPVRVALCHPAPYAVGMSSLGYQTIYREIHLHPDCSAERAFVPGNPEEYRKSHLPILTYESETPIANFPVVAFSIAYELELTGILEILDLSGIPLLRSDRSEKHPLILAGGPLTNSNPLPLAPFVDLIILGEGGGSHPHISGCRRIRGRERKYPARTYPSPRLLCSRCDRRPSSDCPGF